MAGFREVDIRIWEQAWFRRLSPDVKVLYYYLEYGSESITGIYPCPIDELLFRTRLDERTVKEALEMKAIPHVRYDFDLEVVFVGDIFRRSRRMGGHKRALQLRIMEEHRRTISARIYWSDWVTEHRDFLEKNPLLEVHFSDLHNPVFPEIPLQITKYGKRRRVRSTVVHTEARVMEMMRRYTRLNEEDRDAFSSAYRALSVGPMKKLHPANVRLSILCKLGRYDVDDVAAGAREFVSSRDPKKAGDPLGFWIAAIERRALKGGKQTQLQTKGADDV